MQFTFHVFLLKQEVGTENIKLLDSFFKYPIRVWFMTHWGRNMILDILSDKNLYMTSDEMSHKYFLSIRYFEFQMLISAKIVFVSF